VWQPYKLGGVLLQFCLRIKMAWYGSDGNLREHSTRISSAAYVYQGGPWDRVVSRGHELHGFADVFRRPAAPEHLVSVQMIFVSRRFAITVVICDFTILTIRITIRSYNYDAIIKIRPPWVVPFLIWTASRVFFVL
jgi:hypothetical protein